MKSAIEKAIENNAEIKQIINADAGHTNWALQNAEVWSGGKYDAILGIKYETESNKFYGEHPDDLQFNFYQLIFGTDFIDKLVKRGNGLIKCFTDKCSCRALLSNQNTACYKHDNVVKCTDFTSEAQFYREVMANIKDIEKLKEYVRGLV